MTKKYELTSETQQSQGYVFYRIRALQDIPRHGVKAGDLGGWIEKEINLSHQGDCWIGEEAKVYENARVFGHAWVFGSASVYGNAWVHGSAWVYGNASVYEYAQVVGDARVYENVRAYGNTYICGEAQVSGKTWLLGNAHIGSNTLALNNLSFLKQEETDSGEEKDPINPSYYTKGIECYDFIKSWNFNYAAGCVIKYITRYPNKGNPLQDLKKARWYLDQLIKEHEDADD